MTAVVDHAWLFATSGARILILALVAAAAIGWARRCPVPFCRRRALTILATCAASAAGNALRPFTASPDTVLLLAGLPSTVATCLFAWIALDYLERLDQHCEDELHRRAVDRAQRRRRRHAARHRRT